MVNEDRTYLMTQMALYEQKKAKHDERIGSYFQGDYVSGRLLESFFCATLLFLVIAGVYCVYFFEEIMQMIYSQELPEIVFKGIILYVVILLVYMLITFFVYNRRYKDAINDLKMYYRALQRLSDEYGDE